MRLECLWHIRIFICINMGLWKYMNFSPIFYLFVIVAIFSPNGWSWDWAIFFNFFFQFFAYSCSVYVCMHKTYNIYVSKPPFRCVFHVCLPLLHAPAKGVGGPLAARPYGVGHFLDPWDRVDHRSSSYSEGARGSRAVTPNAFPMGVPIIRESQWGYTYI